MVVNYDLPLLNDQAEEKPDIDTYRHRIGASLSCIVPGTIFQVYLLSCQVERVGSAARVSQ